MDVGDWIVHAGTLVAITAVAVRDAVRARRPAPCPVCGVEVHPRMVIRWGAVVLIGTLVGGFTLACFLHATAESRWDPLLLALLCTAMWFADQDPTCPRCGTLLRQQPSLLGKWGITRR